MLKRWKETLGLLAASSLLFTGCVTKAYHQKKMAQMAKINGSLHDAIAKREVQLREARAKCRAQLGMLKDKNSKQAQKLRKTLAHLQALSRDPFGDKAMHGRLTKVFSMRIREGQLNLRVENGFLKLSLPDKVLFDTNSARVSKEGRKIIAEVARELKRYTHRWQVAGHTDSVGDAMYNRKLSARRAMAVFKVMTQAGMPSKRLTVSAFGEVSPLRPNDTQQARAHNRRVELILQPRFERLQVKLPKPADKISRLCPMPQQRPM